MANSYSVLLNHVAARLTTAVAAGPQLGAIKILALHRKRQEVVVQLERGVGLTGQPQVTTRLPPQDLKLLYMGRLRTWGS
jgi:hypothetical protein